MRKLSETRRQYRLLSVYRLTYNLPAVPRVATRGLYHPHCPQVSLHTAVSLRSIQMGNTASERACAQRWTPISGSYTHWLMHCLPECLLCNQQHSVQIVTSWL